MQKKINYFSRNFQSVRAELIEFVKKHFPDTYSDFNDASVGTMLIELNAALGDMLSYNTDRAVQETNIDFAQEKRSLLAIARTFGLRIPFKRPAITIVDFTVEVPVKGDTFDLSYCPLIVRGAQVQGGGQIFETITDIDFASPYNTSNLSNRLIIPNIDGSGKIVSYTLTKRELVVAGKTKFFKRIITSEDVRPFLQVDLPESDVLSVENIISLDGTDYERLPTLAEQTNPENLWYSVKSLAENKMFVEQPLQPSDKEGVLVGEWTPISQRFMYEYSDKGFATIRFGNGLEDTTGNDNYVSDAQQFLDLIQNFAIASSLGDIPRVNTTMFIKYRVGGGSKSNVGVNTLTTLGTLNVFVGGQNNSQNLRVKNSLKVNNPIPALGGVDEPDIEDIRNLVKYNFSSQERCVTLKDYYARVMLMDGKFGTPYKLSVANIDNKIDISILGLDINGKLTNQSTTTLQENIVKYLGNYKMINDYISVRDGRIINIGFEFDIFTDSAFNRNEIAVEVINVVYKFIQEKKLIMGQDIYLSQLLELVNNVGGVLNIIDFRVYNKVGQNLYSLNEINQPLTDTTTRQVDLLSQNAIFADYDEIFEIKYSERDIKVRFTTN
jgi:hypothetical protein